MEIMNKDEMLRKNGTYNNRHGKVKCAQFSEGAFYNPKDLVQVKYEMLRDAEITGRTVKEAAEDYGFSRAAYYSIKEGFEQQGMAALFPKKPGPKQPRKLTVELQGFIDEFRRLNPDAGTLELVNAIFEQEGVEIGRRTIERYNRKKK